MAVRALMYLTVEVVRERATRRGLVTGGRYHVIDLALDGVPHTVQRRNRRRVLTTTTSGKYGGARRGARCSCWCSTRLVRAVCLVQGVMFPSGSLPLSNSPVGLVWSKHLCTASQTLSCWLRGVLPVRGRLLLLRRGITSVALPLPPRHTDPVHRSVCVSPPPRADWHFSACKL